MVVMAQRPVKFDKDGVQGRESVWMWHETSPSQGWRQERQSVLMLALFTISAQRLIS